MNITILDADTLGSDVSLSAIENFGTIEKYGTTLPEQTKNRIGNSEIIITNKVVIGQKEMAAAKNLKMICVAATGYNNIDLKAACKAGITVANVKGYSTESVAQTVMAYILTFSTNTEKFADYTASGQWQKSEIFTCLKFPFFELKGKKLGIFGYGTIGNRVAKIAKVFGMELLIAESKRPKSESLLRFPPEKVLSDSDFISIHTPLTPETKNMITAAELNQMKASAFLINTARGGIVNEADLARALETGTIAGAAFDVLSQEPPKDENPLIGAPNMILTPHIAWTSKESRERLIKGIAENIQTFVDGKAKSINLC
jgi:glycerate dehydrogenase